jgi:hypothetical protein
MPKPIPLKINDMRKKPAPESYLQVEKNSRNHHQVRQRPPFFQIVTWVTEKQQKAAYLCHVIPLKPERYETNHY